MSVSIFDPRPRTMNAGSPLWRVIYVAPSGEVQTVGFTNNVAGSYSPKSACLFQDCETSKVYRRNGEEVPHPLSANTRLAIESFRLAAKEYMAAGRDEDAARVLGFVAVLEKGGAL